MSGKHYHISVPVVVWLICSAIFFCGCTKKEKKQHEEREIRVSVQKLEKRIFRRQLPVQGTVNPVNFAILSAKIGGTIEEFRVGTGSKLKKGDVIYEIDRKVLKNQVIMREDEIKVKEAGLQTALANKESSLLSRKKAELDFNRAKKLSESKAISTAEYEEFETAYKKAQTDVACAEAAVANAKAQLKQAESNLIIASKNLDDSVQKAPFDCTVVGTDVEEFEYVSTGQSVLKVENLDSLELVCYISSVYYQDIRKGETKVEISVHGERKGIVPVSFKGPSIDPKSRTFEVKAKVPSEFGLVSGMLCSANIILEEKEAWGLPADAFLLRANDRYIVYSAGNDNRAKSHDVKPGIVDGIYREVLNPEVIRDENIIVSGQTFVNTGALLRVNQVKK